MARDMIEEAEVITDASKNPAVTRARWLAELRRQGHRQCHGNWQNGMRVCALGLLAEVAGIPDANDRDNVPEIGALAGLCEDGAYLIVSLNDRQHTFSKIADVVEGWF